MRMTAVEPVPGPSRTMPKELLNPWSGVFVLGATVPQPVQSKPSMSTPLLVWAGSAEPSVMVRTADVPVNEKLMVSLSETALMASRKVQWASQLPSSVSSVELTVSTARAVAGTARTTTRMRSR